jgi:hypothetical protein
LCTVSEFGARIDSGVNKRVLLGVLQLSYKVIYKLM